MARSAAASARLEAVAAAKRLHRDLRLKERAKSGESAIDVFEVIAELGIPLVFKPLTSALGLCLPSPNRGIMITTRRPFHIQRFTAAHELGHAVLDHTGSVDKEILERGSFGPSHGRDLQEVAADAFAAEFLLPRWLYKHHIQMQGWSVGQLKTPDIVYQLSLRMAASYEATCWGLLGHQILELGAVDLLRSTKVAQLKASLKENVKAENAWADVWRITERDAESKVQGNPDDLLRIELPEDTSGGYQWKVEDLQAAGFELLWDKSFFSAEPIVYGAPSVRTLLVHRAAPGNVELSLHDGQPWKSDNEDVAQFYLKISLCGAETGGLSRADRRRRGAT